MVLYTLKRWDHATGGRDLCTVSAAEWTRLLTVYAQRRAKFELRALRRSRQVIGVQRDAGYRPRSATPNTE